MNFRVKFNEENTVFRVNFGEVQTASDGGYERGYERGYEAGYKKGYAEGETAGYTQGEAHGRAEGYAQGKTDGHAEGYAKGYADGYAAGYEAGQEVGYAKGYAEGETDGYNEGHTQGYTEGETAGIEAGKKAEYDRFWDSYQDYGNRTDYQNGFSGVGWSEKTFAPKYDVRVENAYMLFRGSDFKDLGAAIHNSGKRIIISGVRFQYTFQNCYLLETIEGIEFTEPLTYMSGAFQNCVKLKKVQTLPISEKATNLDWGSLHELVNISFSGVLPVSFSFAQSSNLAAESIQNIIDHLKDLTGQTAQTLTLHADVGGKLTAEQKAAITAKNWTLVY